MKFLEGGHMEKAFSQPMQIVERLWLGTDGAHPPYVNQVVIEGQGALRFKELQSAVEKASAANPGSRLILKGALRWCRWVDSGRTPPLRWLTGSSWDGCSSENAPFLAQRLPYTGPTCEVVYLAGPVPRVIFRSSHAIMDGMGTIYWAEEVFRVLRGEEPLGSRTIRSMVKFVRQFTEQTRKMPPLNSIAPTGRARGSRPGARWTRLTLTGTFGRVLGKVCWVLAQSAWRHGDGEVTLAVPVDLRSRQPGLRSTGNMAMAIYVKAARDATPETIARDIRWQLDNKYDCMLFEGGTWVDLIPIALLQSSFRWITRVNHLQGAYTASALVSNLGRIDTGRFCCPGFQPDGIFLIPPRFDSVPAFAVLTGHEDRLELTLSLPDVLATDNRLEKLLENISQVVSRQPLESLSPSSCQYSENGAYSLHAQ
jgi:hypothetical protein